MKNIKELGLETIQLEDQVLLVKNGEIPKNWYLDDANQIRESVIDDPDWWCARKGYRSIIASTKPLEGLPLLVIEDEVENLANQAEIEEYKDNDPYDQFYAGGDFYDGFKQGYNKARQTYKFTEEDMVEFAMNMISQYQFGNTNIHNRGMLRESLPQKELWIEVEFKETKSSVFRENDAAPYGKYEPKIVNNQIKGIYR